MTTKLQKIWKWKAANDSYDLYWPDEEETRLKIQKQAATKPEQGYFIKAEQLKSIMMKCSYDGLDQISINDLLKKLGVKHD